MDPEGPGGGRDVLLRHEASPHGRSAYFAPESPDATRYILRPDESQTVPDVDSGLPLPPPDLWAGMADSTEAYLSTGRLHQDRMIELLGSTGFALAPGQRLYELGCATGRVLRHLWPAARTSEVWGSDLSARHVHWCQRWLSPPFHFFTNTTFPHLPMPDDHFDLIYAMSVFTHIGDLEDAWLLELKRVLKPGGRLYVTVHDNRTIDLLLSSPPGHWLHDSAIRQDLLAFDEEMGITSGTFDLFVTSRDAGNAQVFHDRGYLQRVWGDLMKVMEFQPEALGYQTAVVMTK